MSVPELLALREALARLRLCEARQAELSEALLLSQRETEEARREAASLRDELAKTTEPQYLWREVAWKFARHAPDCAHVRERNGACSCGFGRLLWQAESHGS